MMKLALRLVMMNRSSKKHLTTHRLALVLVASTTTVEVCTTSQLGTNTDVNELAT